MKPFIAVVAGDGAVVTKYQDYDTEAEADAHVVEFGGYVVPSPGEHIQYWVADLVAKTVTYDQAAEDADNAAAAATRYQGKRQAAFASLGDQLDMQYWDLLDGTSTWKDHISAVKAKHPKPE